MIKFKKFISLIEQEELEQEHDNNKNYFSDCKNENWWENICTIKTGDWEFVIPSLGGNSAKGKQDLQIKHKNYFRSPINLEIKSFKSKLAYSQTAKRIKESTTTKFNLEPNSGTKNTQTRQIFDPLPQIQSMKKVLDSNGIETTNNPIEIHTKYTKLAEERRHLHNEELHIHPISTHVLQEIEKHWRESGIHGVFMSSGKSEHYSKHSSENPVRFENFPKSYRKSYNQIHDIIDVVSKWKPLTENEDKKNKGEVGHEGMKVWSTDENSEHRLSNHAHGISFINPTEYTLHKEGDDFYFVPSHLYDKTGKLITENFDKWKMQPTSSGFRKTENGNYVQIDPKTQEPKEKSEELTEEEIKKRHANIRKRQGSIGLSSEGNDKIHSGYDHTINRHVLHQFLDEEYKKIKPQNKK